MVAALAPLLASRASRASPPSRASRASPPWFFGAPAVFQNQSRPLAHRMVSVATDAAGKGA